MKKNKKKKKYEKPVIVSERARFSQSGVVFTCSECCQFCSNPGQLQPSGWF